MSAPFRPGHRFSPFRLLLGWLLIVPGLIVTPMPIPLGLLMIGSGLVLLSRESRCVRRQLKKLRTRYPGLSARLEKAAQRMPVWLRETIRQTEPDNAAHDAPVEEKD